MNEHQKSTDDEREIRALVENWASAVRRRDIAVILRSHSSDMLIFDVPPPLQSKGIDEYRRTWDVFFAWALDPVKYDIVEMRVAAGSNVAFVSAVMQCAGREASGEKIVLNFRLTIGLRKLNGEWIVEHEHHSIPAEN